MRITFVNPIAALGGAERSMLDLIASLQACERAPECSLVTFGEGPLTGRAAELGIDVRVLALPQGLAGLGESAGGLRHWRAMGPQLLNAVSFATRLRRELSATRPDIVHTNGMKAHALCAATTARQTPVLVHLRDFLTERPVASRGARLLRFRAARVVANSNAVAEDARQCMPSVPVDVVYNGIDTRVFCAGVGESAWLAGLAALEPPAPGTLCIGLVATYANWKGQDIFIRAVSRLKAAGAPPFRAYVIGGPVYETQNSQFSLAQLRSVAERSGVADVVGFVPFQTQVERVYRSLDLAVHASVRREAFGRTIVEAMACERAVIVAEGGCPSELFEEGKHALGFARGDSTSLAAVMLRLMGDEKLRDTLGKQGRAHVLRRFDSRRLGPEMLAIYDKVLEREC